MKKNFLLFFFILLCIASALIIISLQSNSDTQSKKIIIVATTSMLADAVRKVVHGVDGVAVYGLMGPGVDPHMYRARESDVHKLAAADVVIYNGLHLEGKMGQVLHGMNRFTAVINASQGLAQEELRCADFEDLYDPHIWFNVALWIKVVRYIQNTIITIDPEHADIYTKNGDEYCAQLQELHTYIKQRVNEIDERKRILITAHDAFGYFGDAYGFTVVGLQGLSTDSDISTKDIQQLADYIVEKQIPVIFVESSIPQRSLMAVRNAVAARGYTVAVGAELYSDALGDQESSVSSYYEMVKYNVDTIVDSLVY